MLVPVSPNKGIPAIPYSGSVRAAAERLWASPLYPATHPTARHPFLPLICSSCIIPLNPQWPHHYSSPGFFLQSASKFAYGICHSVPPTSSLNRSTIFRHPAAFSPSFLCSHFYCSSTISSVPFCLFFCVSCFVLISQFRESLSDFYPCKQFIALTTQLVACSSITIYFLVHALSHHVQRALQGSENLSQKSMVGFSKSSEGSQQEEPVEIRKVR